MRAGFGAFLEHDHGDILAGFGRPLLDADRGRQARRPAADDHDVVLHGFAGTVLFEELLLVHGGLFACRAFAYGSGG